MIFYGLTNKFIQTSVILHRTLKMISVTALLNYFLLFTQSFHTLQSSIVLDKQSISSNSLGMVLTVCSCLSWLNWHCVLYSPSLLFSLCSRYLPSLWFWQLTSFYFYVFVSLKLVNLFILVYKTTFIFLFVSLMNIASYAYMIILW